MTASPAPAIERVSDDRLLGRALLLSIADDVAGWVAGDRLASPSEREAARAHGAYLRQRMRRILGLLEGRGGSWAACPIRAIRRPTGAGVGWTGLSVGVQIREAPTRRRYMVVAGGASVDIMAWGIPIEPNHGKSNQVSF